jgi:LuxR family maltose regulon positive regulatory protein
VGTPDLPTEPVLLLRTKLHRPRIPAPLVRRSRLESRLNRGLDRGLILVSAPAGFGKTTLVSQWLETCSCPAAWLSLREEDSDLPTFLRYLIAAIRTLYPDACRETWALLRAPQLPPVAYLATMLVNELDEVPQAFVLVLDDFHRIQSQPVHQFVETLVDSVPRTLCLVLITRVDPSLPLPALRAGQKMLELRSGDLRLTPDEVRDFFGQCMGLEVDAESLAILEQRTEGWIVGLRLAALSLRDAGELTTLTRNLGGSDRHVMDYLLAEVLSHQPQAVQEVLLRSSILQRFCISLLDALLDRDRSGNDRAPGGGTRAMLEWMERSGLFLVALDDERTWYRYHHLFRELLQHKLRSESSEELVASLHVRASDWLAAEGLIEEAMHHALAAADAPRAARIVEQHRHALLNREHWHALVRWVDLLPQEVVHQRPGLLLARAWHQQWRWQYATMPPLLQTAEELISRDADTTTDAERQIMRGEIDTLWSALWFARGDGRRCLEYAQRARERLPAALVYARALFLEYLAWGYQMTGQAGAGIRILEEAYASDEAREDLFTARMLLGLAVIYYLSGDLRLQEQMASRLLALSPEKPLALSRSWAHLISGQACYQQNRLEEAATHFSAVTEPPYLANAAASQACLLGLALTYQAQDRPEAATQVAEASLAFALEIRQPVQMVEARAFQARLALLQGDLTAALRWAQGVTSEELPARTLFPEVPRVTLARVLIAQGTRDSLQKASQILDEILEIARGAHSAPHTIELLALQALVYDAQGKGQKALDVLRQSLELAQPGGFLRVFVDLGSAMIPLLSRLAEFESEPNYIGRILAAFAPSPLRRHPLRLEQTAQLEIVESLTNREQEILELLARRLSDKEIAQALHISPYTVRKHTSNLYGKLQVAGRRQAVRKAKALGVLPAE